jgi:hypothetical protein
MCKEIIWGNYQEMRGFSGTETTEYHQQKVKEIKRADELRNWISAETTG